MNIYPTLTISLLSQLTDRQLQSNYLNHLDRTAEITSLLTQIADNDLALRIINLALEVDLHLGASLAASIDPALQQIIVDRIDRLEIHIRLKIELWRRTKSKSALPYLQDIFIFKHRQSNDWDGHGTIESAILAIIDIDRDLAGTLLIKDLADPNWLSSAAKYLALLAPVEAIEALAPLLNISHLTSVWNGHHFAMEALEKIGTDEAIDKIRVALDDRSRWSERPYIYGLGIVADPAMVEHLLNLLYLAESDELCCEGIEALERIGGEKVFDWLHQSMYWISNADEFSSPFQKIVEALFKLDTARTLTALESAIKSYAPQVRKRAAMALFGWNISLCDRNIIILLNAIDDPDLDVQIEIVCLLRDMVDRIFCISVYEPVDVATELLDRAILATKPIILKYINHPDLEIRDRAISNLSTRDADERYLIECVYVDPPVDLPTLLELLYDPEIEIRESAVESIVALENVAIFPIVLELASNSELVATLICKLKKLADRNLSATIFNEFRRNRDIALKFIETAEKTNIENIRNKTHHVNGEIFALREIGDNLGIVALQEILEAADSYDDIDQAVLSLANIGTEQAMSVLLSFLPDLDKFYGWIAMQLNNLGKLGLIPQLWLAAHQFYSWRSSEAISVIQEREGLYNPDFSDRYHPLFEPSYPRLRQILLGDN
jgi:HEAT repeat protein